MAGKEEKIIKDFKIKHFVYQNTKTICFLDLKVKKKKIKQNKHKI